VISSPARQLTVTDGPFSRLLDLAVIDDDVIRSRRSRNRSSRSGVELGPHGLPIRVRRGTSVVRKFVDDRKAVAASFVGISGWHRQGRSGVSDFQPKRIVVPRLHVTTVIGVPDHVRHEFARHQFYVVGQWVGLREQRTKRPSRTDWRILIMPEVERDVRCWPVGLLIDTSVVPAIGHLRPDHQARRAESSC
jgi:hypothetical protein